MKVAQVWSTVAGTVKVWLSSTGSRPCRGQDGPSGQDRGEAPAVGAVAVEGRRRVRARGGRRPGRTAPPPRLVGGALAHEGLLHGAGAKRGGPHVGQPDLRLGDRAAVDA